MKDESSKAAEEEREEEYENVRKERAEERTGKSLDVFYSVL